VWKDLDRNGRQDAGEPGIEGVAVTLYDSSGVAIGSTTTNSLGYYSFTELAPGTYGVGFPTIIGQGMVLTTADNALDALDSDASTSTGLTITTVLSAGENDPTWDAGYVSSLASLGDFVWSDLDEDGVQDGRARHPGRDRHLAQQQRCGHRQHHHEWRRLLQLHRSSARHLCRAVPDHARHHRCAHTSRTGHAGHWQRCQYGTGNTANVTLSAGQNYPDLDAGYVTPLLASIGNFVWSDLDRDGDQDAGEPGIQGITVTLLDSGGSAVGTTTTDATGYYAFTNLQPGTYAVQFPLTAGASSVLTGIDLGGDDTLDSDARFDHRQDDQRHARRWRQQHHTRRWLQLAARQPR
jgi:hypothetical protein